MFKTADIIKFINTSILESFVQESFFNDSTLAIDPHGYKNNTQKLILTRVNYDFNSLIIYYQPLEQDNYALTVGHGCTKIDLADQSFAKKIVQKIKSHIEQFSLQIEKLQELDSFLTKKLETELFTEYKTTSRSYKNINSNYIDLIKGLYCKCVPPPSWAGSMIAAPGHFCDHFVSCTSQIVVDIDKYSTIARNPESYNISTDNKEEIFKSIISAWLIQILNNTIMNIVRNSTMISMATPIGLTITSIKHFARTIKEFITIDPTMGDIPALKLLEKVISFKKYYSLTI